MGPVDPAPLMWTVITAMQSEGSPRVWHTLGTAHLTLHTPMIITGTIIISTFHRGKLVPTDILELAKGPKRHNSYSKARTQNPLGTDTS